jgi:RNA polymerase sigma-70 factor (ECF subfamily)
MTPAPGSFDGSTEPSPAAAEQAQLRRLAASQEQQAWTELYQRLAPTLFAVARRLTRAPGDAEDAVQQTFLQLFRARAAFARAEAPRAYALRALRHTLARQAPRISAQLSEDHAAAAAPSADLERTPQLERALAALPFEQREALELKLEGELTFAELGDVLGVPADTAASRYRRALEKLRERLGGAR